MVIGTWEGLTAWLEDEDWFAHGRLFAYRPEPVLPVPTTVELELGRWVVGGFDSGDDRTLRTFKVLATGVTDFSIESPGHIPDSLSSEGLELEERELRFTIIIQTPGALRLTFESWKWYASTTDSQLSNRG